MTDVYNASDRKAIRKAIKDAKAAENQRRQFIFNLMSSPAGRTYIHDLLVRCHVFSTSFNTNPLALAFAEGERNIGIQLLNDILSSAPDQYIQMMREYNDRSIATDRGSKWSSQDQRWADSGFDAAIAGIDSDPDSGSGDEPTE